MGIWSRNRACSATPTRSGSSSGRSRIRCGADGSVHVHAQAAEPAGVPGRVHGRPQPVHRELWTARQPIGSAGAGDHARRHRVLRHAPGGADGQWQPVRDVAGHQPVPAGMPQARHQAGGVVTTAPAGRWGRSKSGSGERCGRNACSPRCSSIWATRGSGIGHFIDFYNFSRTHTGIEGMVPADRFLQRATPAMLESLRKRGWRLAMRAGVGAQQRSGRASCIWQGMSAACRSRCQMAIGDRVTSSPRMASGRRWISKPSSTRDHARSDLGGHAAGVGADAHAGGARGRGCDRDVGLGVTSPQLPAPRRSMRCPHPGATAAGREVRHERRHGCIRSSARSRGLGTHSRGGSARCHHAACVPGRRGRPKGSVNGSAGTVGRRAAATRLRRRPAPRPRARRR